MAGSARSDDSRFMEQKQVSAIHWSAQPVEVDAVMLLVALLVEGCEGERHSSGLEFSGRQSPSELTLAEAVEIDQRLADFEARTPRLPSRKIAYRRLGAPTKGGHLNLISSALLQIRDE